MSSSKLLRCCLETLAQRYEYGQVDLVYFSVHITAVSVNSQSAVIGTTMVFGVFAGMENALGRRSSAYSTTVIWRHVAVYWARLGRGL